MIDWKRRQLEYLKTNGQLEWHEPDLIVLKQDDIRHWALRYFWEDFEELVYPSKSFSVAYIYACLIQELFEPNKTIKELLSDPDLFRDTDPYYVVYNEDTQHIYDALIEQVGRNYLNTAQARITREYFLKEMRLESLITCSEIAANVV